MISNEMYEVHFQTIREIHVRLSLLQNYFVVEQGIDVRKFRKIGEVTGVATDGSIDINANSAVRRTCSINMHVIDSSFLISEKSKIWMDKWFKVEIGIRHLKKNEIIWFNKGIFAINNPSVQYSSTKKQLQIEGLDLMCTLNGVLGGELEMTTNIPTSSPIHEAVRTTVNRLGKISLSNIYVEENPDEIPTDIEKSSGDTVYAVIEELKNLYMDWETFFDVEGKFIYQRIKNRFLSRSNFNSDVITYSFLKDNDLAINYNLSYDFSNVKNRVIIYGKLRDDGAQVKKIIENTEPKSPFNINKSMGVITKIYNDDNIFNEEQVEQRARYEFWKHNNFNERVDVESLPIYFIDVNQLIEFDREEIGLKGMYLIDSISIPLGHSGTMKISAHRVYQSE